MVIIGNSAFLAPLLFLFAFGVADAIRALKGELMIDAEGREYKSAAARSDVESISESQTNEGSNVHVQCTDVSMIIMINADLYKTGHLVSPDDLFLGEAKHSQSSQCRAVAVTETEYVIEAGLQDCGSKLTISEDSTIYSNTLMFSPAARYHDTTKTTRTVVPVSCHFRRTQFVSSHMEQQPLTLSTSAQYSTGHSTFSLKLMTDDWMSENLSDVFYLGDVLHLEASYTGPDAARRRLYVDSCVATLTPDTMSVPRYYFIENHGCVIDAKQAGSNALFRPRTRINSLQLQLDAFLFDRDPRNTIFITCQLKATSEIWQNHINKACNYVHSRWRNVDGAVGMCQCCDSTCYNRSKFKGTQILQNMVCGSVTLGPLMIFPRK